MIVFPWVTLVFLALTEASFLIGSNALFLIILLVYAVPVLLINFHIFLINSDLNLDWYFYQYLDISKLIEQVNIIEKLISTNYRDVILVVLSLTLLSVLKFIYLRNYRLKVKEKFDRIFRGSNAPEQNDLPNHHLYNPKKYIKKERNTVFLGRSKMPGKLFYKKVYLPISNLKYSMAISGITGSGKSTLSYRLAEACIKAGVNVLVLDFKGSNEFSKILSTIAKKQGKEFFYFTSNMESQENQELCQPFNPLTSNKKHGNYLSDTVVKPFDLKSDGDGDYYNQNIISFLDQFELLSKEINKELTFEDIYYFLADEKVRTVILESFKNTKYKTQLNELIDTVSDRNIKDLKKLKTKISKFVVGSPLGDKLNQAMSLDLEKNLEGDGNITLISLSLADNLLINETIGRLIINNIKGYCSRRQAENKVYDLNSIIIADEAHELINTDMDNFITSTRSAGLGLVLLFQSLALLEPRIQDVLLDNTHYKAIFQTRVGADKYSDIEGTKETKKFSKVSEDSVLSENYTGYNSVTMGTRTYHLPPDWLRTVRRGQFVFLTAEDEPIVVSSPYVEEDIAKLDIDVTGSYLKKYNIHDSKNILDSLPDKKEFKI
jgi:DNA helicase HerA-like ATPase